jgi:hypothetical protein
MSLNPTPIYEGTSPLVSDRYIITMIAASAITMGQALELVPGSNWNVQVPTTNPSAHFIGFALNNAASGAAVSVVCRGVCKAIAGGTIAVGDQLVTTTSGQVLTESPAPTESSYASVATDINNARSIIGLAITAASSGGTVYVLLF